MGEHESPSQRDHQKLQELFVSVTGESIVTDRQDQESANRILDTKETDSPPEDYH